MKIKNQGKSMLALLALLLLTLAALTGAWAKRACPSPWMGEFARPMQEARAA
jgi:hypothetical protein